MRKWKVVLGLTLCTGLCAAALADTLAVSQAQKQEQQLTRAQKLELLENMTAAQRTSAFNPFALSDVRPGTNASRFAIEGDPGAIEIGESGEPPIPPSNNRGLTDNTCAQGLTGAQYLIPCDNSDTIITFATPFVEDNERRPTCAVSPTGGQYFLHNSVWVRFIATAIGAKADICQDATAVIDAAVLAVYGPLNPDQPLSCTNIVEIGCEIFNCGPDEGSSEVVVGPLVVGNPYMVQAACFRLTGDSCLAPPFNCRVAGDYKLRVDCNADYVPCQISWPPNSPDEWELEPCGEATRLNDGCNQDPVAFATITCGEVRHGTSTFDGTNRDTDWYRLLITQASTITVTVKAEFVPDVFIIKKGDPSPCDDLEIVASNPLGAYVECDEVNPATVSYAAQPGEYWIFVAPNFCYGRVRCTEDYYITVNATPCFPATGACCTGANCAQVEKEDCISPSVYYGDGSQCVSGLCWSCPANYVAEGETINCANPDGFADSINGGCGWSQTTPTFINIGNLTTSDDNNVWGTGARRCGTSGTFFDAAPPANTVNRRDNDWYRFNLSGVSVGQVRRIRVTYRAEFPTQILIVNPDLGNNPCPTFAANIVGSFFLDPSATDQVVTACVTKKAVPSGQLNLYSDVWVIVRPWLRGTPREIPCGVRYYVGMQVQNCTLPGACCVITGAGVSSGCQILTAANCAAAGGSFSGEGSTCAQVCCPCENGLTAENSICPNFGDPNYVDSVNGGCNVTTTYPFDTVRLANSGNVVCGTVAYNGSTRDLDWFKYNHTAQGDIRLCVTAAFAPILFITKPPAGQPINIQCDQDVTVAAAIGPNDCQEFCITALNQPAGEYWLIIAPDFNANDAVNCPAGAYRASVTRLAPTPTGACCLPNNNGCVTRSQPDCVAAGGQFQGDGSSCTTAVCPNDCPLVCDSFAFAENEPNCGNPDTVNGGCNTDPQRFLQLASNGAAVCGTVRKTTDPNGSTRDTDWYEYNHTGGDLMWVIAGEFNGTVFAVGTIYNQLDKCCASYDTFTGSFTKGCNAFAYVILNAPAGQWQFIVVPSFDEPDVACGAKYQLQVGSGALGACCFSGGGCAELVPSICTINGGTPDAAPSCDPNPCGGGPVGCPGDSDCDGDIDFDDIDFFVAALSGEQAWIDLHIATFGQAPTCPYSNNDVDGIGGVTFDDIDPFVAVIGSSCP